MEETIQPAQSTPTDAVGQLRILLGISALYIGFGMTMGLIQGGFPAIMRAQGVSLGSVGWLYALYLPLGIAFLWAPLVDRWHPSLLPPRLAWIIPMQVVAALIAASVALLEGAAIGILFVMGLFVAFAMATMDIALDALAVERVHPSWRPRAAASKLAALSVGAMIGGGAFVALFHTYGWAAIFLCYAAILMVLVLPILLLVKEGEGGRSLRIANRGTASLCAMLRNPVQRKRLFLLTLACCIIFPLAGLNRLMLIDLQVPIEQIGGIVGTLGPITMLIIAGVSMPLMRKKGLWGTLLVFTLIGLLALGAMALGFSMKQPWAAIFGAIAIGASVSGIFVVLSARILGWSRGGQPATDYATFYGVGRFISTFATIAVSQMVTTISWPLFYALGALALLIILGVLRAPMTEKDE